MSKEKSWQEFFDEHADYYVGTFFYDNRGSFSLEELYQAFKARLEAERRSGDANETP